MKSIAVRYFCPVKLLMKPCGFVGTIFFVGLFLQLNPSRLNHADLLQRLPVSVDQTYWRNFFAQALETSDLDARDKFNRPVVANARPSQLQQLFSFSVFRLLLSADLPYLAAVRQRLQEQLNPFCEQLAQQTRRLIQAFELMLFSVMKRFADSGVSKIWTILNLCMAGTGILCRYRFYLIGLYTAANFPIVLPMRC